VPSILSFTPAIAAVGAQITVTGTNLAGVTAVRVAGVAAAFTPQSATELKLTVPTGAASGRIEVSSSGGSALSATDLTVMAVPAITSVTPTTVRVGDTLTISGTNLDQVKSALLNGVNLPFVGTPTATALIVRVPIDAPSSVLTLVGKDDVERPSAQQITVLAPLVITSFTPAAALAGASVTISGTGLNRATSVSFNGSAAAISAQTASSITATVPAGASTGPITVAVSPTESTRTSTNFTVIPRISVDGAAVYNAAAAGASVTIAGTGLDQVSGVTVAGSAARITSRSATQLVFAAPAGLACGAISLQSTTQPSVAAGNLIVGAGCSTAVNISGIEFAQVQSQTAGSPYQRLALGKETWVRAYVTSTTAGRAAPAVKLVGFNGATPLGTLDMTGPATLPQLAAGGAPPDSQRYDLTQTFRVQLPAAWVNTGLKVRVDVDPDNLVGAFTSESAAPTTGSATRLEVVMVPLVSGTNSPTMPTQTAVLDELTRAFPIPRDQITVTFRAPYTLTSVTDGVDTSQEWRDVLAELDQLRAREAPTKLHYGMVKPMVSAGTAGIGYVNPVMDFSPNLASLGWDATRASWPRTMVHELGHNFSREHAPCGSVNSSDPNYPYAGGAMPTVPLFDSNADTISAPTSGQNQYDVMGYCNGRWFSDYNYSFVQQFLEYQRSQGRLSVQSKSAYADTGLIVVSGTIDANGAQIDSVLPATGAPQAPGTSAHQLELVTADGRVISVPVSPKRIDHADPPAMHFSASIPNPGTLAKLRVLHQGKTIGEHTQAAFSSPAKAAADSAPWARVEEIGTTATFYWNAALHPNAALVHVFGGERTVLAVKARGGKARVDVGALARGGVFEVGLSDGLNVQTLTITR
jgi:hypothetical protein